MAIQLLLLTGIALLPLLRPARPPSHAVRGVGTALLGTGSALVTWSALRLGRNLTPLPMPRNGGHLVQTGPYALARHPLYGGLLLAAVGWATWRGHAAALGLSVLLAALFARKSRREETYLTERFPEYPAYQWRVRKFIPWVY